MKLLLLSLTLIPALASAETTEEPAPPPSKRVLQTALSWMQSEDSARRLAAYRSVHLLGEEALPGFKIALKAALKFHEKRLGNILNGSAGDGNPYRKLGEALDELATERPRVYALIKTDYKKDSGKIAMLRNEVNAVTRIYDRAKQLTKADTSKIETDVDGVALAVPLPEVAKVKRARDAAAFPSEARIGRMATNYYDKTGEWAGTFRLDRVGDIRVDRGSDPRRFVAHVAYRYAPVKKGGKPGDDKRTFTFVHNNGRWQCAEMGGHDSGRL